MIINLIAIIICSVCLGLDIAWHAEGWVIALNTVIVLGNCVPVYFSIRRAYL